MVPYAEAYFPSPGDPQGLIPPKVKLRQRDALFAILAVAVAKSDAPVDVDAGLQVLNAEEGHPVGTNHLLAEEIKKTITTLKAQFGAQREKAQEPVEA